MALIDLLEGSGWSGQVTKLLARSQGANIATSDGKYEEGRGAPSIWCIFRFSLYLAQQWQVSYKMSAVVQLSGVPSDFADG